MQTYKLIRIYPETLKLLKELKKKRKEDNRTKLIHQITEEALTKPV